MNLRIASCSLAVSAAFAALAPLNASAAPTVSFSRPLAGAPISGNIYQSSACEVIGDRIDRVRFYAISSSGTSTVLNVEENSRWQCNIETRNFANGTYTLRAVAYDSAGATATTNRAVTIQNGTTVTPTPTPTVTPTPTPTPTVTPTVSTGPSVSWNAPAVGATLRGTISLGTSCQVSGSGITRVIFHLDNTQLNTELSSPWQCTFDTRRFPDGAHVLKAVAYNSSGGSTTNTRAVTIQNGTTTVTPTPTPTVTPTPTPTVTPTPTTTGGTVSAAHIIGRASGDLPFAQQSGYTAQILGTYPSASSIPEAGIHSSTLPNGETLRLGKVVDPTNSVKKALCFQLHPSDPSTSGSKRAEIAFAQNIEMEKVYWAAFKVYVYDWGTLSSSDAGLFGTQLHSGDNSAGNSPSFGIYTNGGGNMRVEVRGSGLSGTLRYAEQPIPFRRWVDFVFKFRQSTGSTGFVQVWMDGNQIVNHSGPVGYRTSYNDYFKFGYYNWSTAFNSGRKVLLRSPTVVADPTGSTYSAETLRALVNQ